MYFSISNFQLNLNKQVTVIIGDTASGKTTLVREILGGEKYTTNASSINVILEESMLQHYLPNSLFILDESVTSQKYKEHISLITKCNREDLYFVLLSRSGLCNIPLSIESIYKFVEVQGITKNIPYVNELRFNLGKFDELLVEDSGTGYEFFKKCFNRCKPLYGNGNVLKNLSEDKLTIFDSLGFGGYLPGLIDACRLNPKLLYAYYGSFEEFLLKTLFNKESNIKLINPEKDATNKLKEIIPDYSKSCNNLEKILGRSFLSILKESELAVLLDYYIEGKEIDVVSKELNKLGIPVDKHNYVRSLLPNINMPDEMLRDAVRSAVKYLM